MSKAIIVYETRSGNTETVAKAVESGLKDSGIEVKSKRVKDTNVEDLSNFDAVVLGSPTYYHDLLGTMKKFLCKMDNVDMKGKIGAAFGSCGLSSESIDMMMDTMKNIFEMDVIEPGLRIIKKPDENGLKQCKEFGKKIAERIKGSHA